MPLADAQAETELHKLAAEYEVRAAEIETKEKQ
jgi:hypothetical protein